MTNKTYLLSAAVVANLALGNLGFANSTQDCGAVLKGAKPTARMRADQVVAYLGDLFERKIIGKSELNRFLQALEKGKIENPIAEGDAENSTTLLIHRNGLDRILNDGEFDSQRLKDWARTALHLSNEITVKRDDIRKETLEIYFEMELVAVPHRKFEMLSSTEPGAAIVDIELTQPIEVMTTNLTQKQWVEIFNENSLQLTRGEHAKKVTIKSREYYLEPENPVRVTWWSAVAAANKLSESKGLKPAYNLSDIRWKKGTSAADGTLQRESGLLQINAPLGNIYLAEGYRLPTIAEFENLRQLEAEQNGSLPLDQRAWHKYVANNEIHPSGQLQPLLLNGKEVFDILGNVMKWTTESYGEEIAGGTNPLASFNKNHEFDKVIMGGSISTGPAEMGPGSRIFLNANEVGGVRFVRSLPSQ